MLSEIGFANAESERKFVKQLSLDKFEDFFCFDTIHEISEYIERELRYINKFKNEALFTNATFSPQHIWDFYELSAAIVATIKKI